MKRSENPYAEMSRAVTRITAREFDGRTGHGGKPAYRQLRPEQLRKLLSEAYLAGARARGGS